MDDRFGDALVGFQTHPLWLQNTLFSLPIAFQITPGECAPSGRSYCWAWFGQIASACAQPGGIVVLHLFELGRVLPEGRVLLLGSPVLGSGVARAMMAHTGLRSLLGRSGIDGLTQAAPEWHGERDLGVIAGTMALGVGRLFGGLQGANDGTVSVCETRLQGATDFVTLAVNHMGMLFSSGVAREACRFLHYGRFDRGVVKSQSLDSVRK